VAVIKCLIENDIDLVIRGWWWLVTDIVVCCWQVDWPAKQSTKCRYVLLHDVTWH